jgi:hypothetical protein
MRFSQLRDLASELRRVRGHEAAVGVQDSDKRLILEGIRSTSIAVAAAAAPVDSCSLEPAAATTMRLIAAKIHMGRRKARETGVEYEVLPAADRPTADQLHYFNVRRPLPMMRLHGVERLKEELEALEAEVRALRVPDEEGMVHLPLVDPATGKAGSWDNAATLMPFGGFELLRESRAEHRFKGENMQGSTQMFVDVTTPDAHVQEWGEASRAILECAERAEALLARSACCSHALVYHQVYSTE